MWPPDPEMSETHGWRPEMHLWREDWSPTRAAETYDDLVMHEWVSKGSGNIGDDGRLRFRGFYGTYQLDVEGSSYTVEFSPDQRHARV